MHQYSLIYITTNIYDPIDTILNQTKENHDGTGIPRKFNTMLNDSSCGVQFQEVVTEAFNVKSGLSQGYCHYLKLFDLGVRNGGHIGIVHKYL